MGIASRPLSDESGAMAENLVKLAERIMRTEAQIGVLQRQLEVDRDVLRRRLGGPPPATKAQGAKPSQTKPGPKGTTGGNIRGQVHAFIKNEVETIRFADLVKHTGFKAQQVADAIKALKKAGKVKFNKKTGTYSAT